MNHLQLPGMLCMSSDKQQNNGLKPFDNQKLRVYEDHYKQCLGNKS